MHNSAFYGLLMILKTTLNQVILNIFCLLSIQSDLIHKTEQGLKRDALFIM